MFKSASCLLIFLAPLFQAHAVTEFDEDLAAIGQERLALEISEDLAAEEGVPQVIEVAFGRRVCIAANSRGERFSGTAWRQSRARQIAMGRCARRSADCFFKGCR